MTLTLSDIAKPGNASGYKYVRSAHAGPNGGGQTDLWKAEKIKNGVREWKAPARPTPRRSAEDAVAFLNGQGVTAVQIGPRTGRFSSAKSNLSRMTSNHSEVNDDPEYRAALGVLRDFRAQRSGKQGYVYLISDSGEYVKVGYSVNPEKRVAELQTGNARQLHLVATIEGTVLDEARLHQRYAAFNTNTGEWFTLHPPLVIEFLNPATGKFRKDHIA